MRKTKTLLLTTSIIAGLGLTAGFNADAKTISQKASAMGANHRVSEVFNHMYSDHDHANDSSYSPDILNFKSGNQRISLRNNSKLSKAVYNASIGTIQNVTVTPDNHYLFVVYHQVSGDDNSMKGQIVRFNISHPEQQKKSSIMNLGHGQSLAYNPTNNKLYMIILGRASAYRAKVMEMNPWSLKPMQTINIHSNSYLISDQLAFDRKGNAYSYTKTYSDQSGKDSLRIYKGKITKRTVHFNLVQAVRHAPGGNDEIANTPQSMAYNRKTNRLYFVSNGEVLSVPVNKLGHLKSKDVKSTVFNTNAEFEGLTFTKNGHPYLTTRYKIFSSNRTF
ncbi:hypothetical protein WR164_14810 [Philodulcilactobacillus myokoensis]|uniref:Extracellular protein n=1 Tax=Philodulcilactobacillus myokoensis TaxID=2929573 RepID=A0A9W6B273_9LACO|nr:hypothetical protein [Philodulcilactobacillus myokoensis]GLB47502.1 hypothetical protein WR164_14810 [Philodulcilactobacillus myokoensis]